VRNLSDLKLVLDYLNFACLVISPLIIILTLERMLRVIKVIREKAIKERMFWTGLTIIFSFLFVEFDFIAVLLSLSYDELAIIRRPVGAIAIISFFKIIKNLMESSARFQIERNWKEKVEKEEKILLTIVIALSFVLFISPFFIGSEIYLYFTFVIGMLLMSFLLFSILALNEVGKVLKDKRTLEFIKYISIALLIFVVVPIGNVVGIILNLSPEYNILRAILVVPYIFSFYEASKNFIEIRSEVELRSLR
jgi:cytochrome c biogenesis protein CcdA